MPWTHWGRVALVCISKLTIIGRLAGPRPLSEPMLQCWQWEHEPLARYAKLRVAHALGMPGTFSPPPRVSDPDIHHDTYVTHVPRCMPRLLTSAFLWSRWRGNRFWNSQHSRRMRNSQFYESGKRPIRNTREIFIVIYISVTQANAFENLRKLMAILSWPLCVNCDGSLVKPPLKLWHRYVITINMKTSM